MAIRYLLIIFWLLFLPACQNNNPEPPARLTSITPTPAVATSMLAPQATPTSVIPAQLPLKTYTHPSHRFSLNYPTNWKFIQRADGVILLEPTAQAGYSVVFSDAGKKYDETELNQFLVTFVAQNFAGEGSKFEPISQETMADGSIVAQFAWLDPNLGPTVSELRVYQKETIIFVLHLSTAENQWEVSRSKLEELAGSFTPLDTNPSPTAEPTQEPPIWTLIGPESQEFAFFYASDWQILEQSKDLISVGLAENQMTFTASNFSWPEATQDPKAAEKAALAHIETLPESYKKVQHLAPVEFPLDTATGATIDFLYVADDGADMAGSVITAAYKGKMYKIVFTAPAAAYEAALQWFNPMYKSFRFLSPEDIIVEEEP